MYLLIAKLIEVDRTEGLANLVEIDPQHLAWFASAAPSRYTKSKGQFWYRLLIDS